MLQERFAPEDQAPTPRQRAFQTAMFLMLTMMLLDPPADPARRTPAPPAPAPLLPRDVAAAAAVDAALRNGGGDDKPRNVSGLYRGTYADVGNATKQRRRGGKAVVSLDMLAVEGLSELFVVRGLVSLTAAGGRSVLTSAYGVYCPRDRSVSLLGNVGAPRSDLALRYNGSAANATAPATTRAPSTASNAPAAVSPATDDEMAAVDALDELLFAGRSPKRRRFRKHRLDEAHRERVRDAGRRLAAAPPPADGRVMSRLVSALAGLRLDVGVDGARAPPSVDATNGSFLLRTRERRSLDFGGRDRSFLHERDKFCPLLVDLAVAPERWSTSAGEDFATAVAGVVTGLGDCRGAAWNVTASASRVDWREATKAAASYASTMSLTAVAQLALFVGQARFARGDHARVAPLSVAAQAVLDAIACVTNFFLAAVFASLFASFATVAVLQLALCGLVELKYLQVALRRPGDSTPNLARRAALLHAQFYSAVLAALLVVYVFQEDLRVAVFLAYSFWVPQIVKNARENTRRAFHPLFLYGTAANRLALPLYCFGSRANVLRVLADDRDIATRRDLGFCAALVAWQAAQVLVLRLQDSRGPRWFVPARLLPPVYDYAREFGSLAAPGEALECSICMGDVDAGDGDVVVTPCDHVFHKRCLLPWLDLKRECPVCRATLPVYVPPEGEGEV